MANGMIGNTLNTIHLIGRLGQDAEFRTVGAHERSLLTFGVATQKLVGPVKDDGFRDTEPEWHDIKCWGRLAETRQGLQKGDRVELRGALRYERFTDANGSARKVAVIEAHTIIVLERRGGAALAFEAEEELVGVAA